jgi:bifunctional non-homologous end joining protein LigD
VSCAVPKGPTLDAEVRRLAMHIEDHPLDYFDFEGVIAAGEYGGGDAIVWDWGSWSQARGDDPLAEIERGDLHFTMTGKKLQGRFTLVRRGPAGLVSSGCCSRSATPTPSPAGNPRTTLDP